MMKSNEWLVPMLLWFIGSLIAFGDHPLVGVCIVIYAAALRVSLAFSDEQIGSGEKP